MREKKETITCKFAMNLWNRIVIATRLWWDIVVKGEMVCMDDRTYSEKVADARADKETKC
jgi:hypothetical protein